VRKLFAAISFIAYFAASSGIVINSHYCMKRLVSVHLFERNAKACSKCGMGMHKGHGCCRDEVKVVKVVVDQSRTPTQEFSFNTPALSTAIVSAYIVLPFRNADVQRDYLNLSPPLLSYQDTYLQIGVFRI
jgi:hypothetical protein